MPCQEREISGRTWYRQRRQCPITRAEFDACWQSPLTVEQVREEQIGNQVRVVRSQHTADPGRQFTSSPAEAWRDLQARMRNAAPLQPWKPPAVIGEALKLESLGLPLLASWWESQAEAMAMPPDQAVRLSPEDFPVVQCSRLIATELRLDAGDFCKRHAAGETVAAYDSLTDDEKFAPAIFDQDVQNAVALVAGDGLIISRFDVSAETGKPGSWLQVVTLLSGDRLPPSTICFCNRDT